MNFEVTHAVNFLEIQNAVLTMNQAPEDSNEEKCPSASTVALLRLNRQEWPLLAWGGLASLLVGATMPIFAILFSKLYGVSKFILWIMD